MGKKPSSDISVESAPSRSYFDPSTHPSLFRNPGEDLFHFAKRVNLPENKGPLFTPDGLSIPAYHMIDLENGETYWIITEGGVSPILASKSPFGPYPNVPGKYHFPLENGAFYGITSFVKYSNPADLLNCTALPKVGLYPVFLHPTTKAHLGSIVTNVEQLSLNAINAHLEKLPYLEDHTRQLLFPF